MSSRKARTTQNSQASGFQSLKKQNVGDSCETAQRAVLVSVTADVMKHHTKSKLGGKGLVCLHFYIAVHHQRKSGLELKHGRKLEAGADAEAMEGAAYCLLHLACTA